jgi:hypothetical protein
MYLCTKEVIPLLTYFTLSNLLQQVIAGVLASLISAFILHLFKK